MSEFEGVSYNSSRPDLAIPEYGRNIHRMIDYAKSVADKEERNKVAAAIISVMGQLFPYLRDIEDYNHKLWDHLHIMANHELDVDSPYPAPNQDTLKEKPNPVAYPQKDMKFGHYGKILEDLIAKASAFDEGDEKQTLALIIGNLMKKHYLTWNRSSVEDSLIKNQLKQMSGGKISLSQEVELIPTAEILKGIKPQHHNKNKKGGGKKKKRKY